MDFPLPGQPCIDIARAVLAERAILSGADVCLWLDADMTFSPEICGSLVEQAGELGGLVGAIYVKKKPGGDMNVILLDDVKKLHFFQGGGTFEVMALGFGCIAHPTRIFEAVATAQELKPRRIMNDTFRPWFTDDPTWDSVHSDDYAFCRRARASGFKVFADTRARVGHIGEYVYHVEDSVIQVPRYLDLEILNGVEDKAAE